MSSRQALRHSCSAARVHGGARSPRPRAPMAAHRLPIYARRFASSLGGPSKTSSAVRTTATTAASLLAIGSLLVFSLAPRDQHMRLDAAPALERRRTTKETQPSWAQNGKDDDEASLLSAGSESDMQKDKEVSTISAVGTWFRDVANVDWSAIPDRITGFILPEWSKMVPGFVRKLQRELDAVPGSLSDEIWREARDPTVHPEVQFGARVRVADDLCRDEKAFRQHRKPVTAAALAKYLDLPADDVHPDDVPVIALCGSGGGLRALVAGTGSLMAAEKAGLFDCVTYMAGVSGSCWMQTLYFSSFTHQDFGRVADHLKARLGVHIAHPPELFALLTSAPTNKYLLSGAVERYKADPTTKFGLVDVYGTLLAARLLVPRGELDVSALDYKISSQRRHLTRGQNPMPIYTAVRHEIPGLEDDDGIKDGAVGPSASGDDAKKEAWFQWFEITPYEFFCEEFSAGIPTWAMGRTFHRGRDVPLAAPNGQGDYHLPEVRTPLMLGIFGSAFCATLSHYYKEIRPIVQSISGMSGLDEMIWGRNDDLSKVHPIEPATLPNPVYGMHPSQLPVTVPPGLFARKHIQLMDAGMSNNLPLYPFLRPGRGVEVVVVFDASADIRKDNWLCVADGYARRRGIKGWPVGVGWPPADDPPEKTAQQLKDAGASAEATPDDKIEQAKADQAAHQRQNETGSTTTTTKKDKRMGGAIGKQGSREAENAKAAAKELGYCTVWVGSTAEKVSTAQEAAETEAAQSGDKEDKKGTKQVEMAPPIDESTQWRLTAPDAGLTLVYLPYLANEAKVPGVDPATSDFMSTWNFVYQPEEVDKAVALARANFNEGADQIRATVRAVYERKKQMRLAAEERHKRERLRRLVKQEGNHFN
ncbi:phospholipase A2 [Sporothrix schenckii 1099-18]|uniref:Lysophospholipase n=1 Tax=Sporothrix schenckii 1099-18 TaxID=1397361 RepID=A0A0F2LWH1_SPOSC|nr:phospholipase A2 [Sporothrix schenckii 1099-18]KJR81803.1 phospholipase A2 [Sporothrix schenckii 1099-18]